MTVFKTIFPVAILAVTVGGCALVGIDTGYRSLTIRNHQFEPAVVTVAQGKPFVLTLNGFDDADLTISAPELGINMLRVPTTQEDKSPLTASRINPGRNARLPLGPLKAGTYTIACACHGNPSQALVIAQ